MAFPGTYNISYYRGDTLEFKVYPKDSTGANFSLSSFNETVRFTIAPRRGALLAGEQRIQAYAKIIDGDYILCVIRPEDGQRMLVETSPYYYDIEIEDYDSESYVKIYTILTGEINVTEQVTPGTDIPYPPDTITLETVEATSITVNWTPPIAGAFAGFIVGINDEPVLDGAFFVNKASTDRTHTFTPVMPGSTYYVGIVAVNAAGQQSAPRFYPLPITTPSLGG